MPDKIFHKALIFSVAVCTLAACNFIPVRRADDLVVKEMTRGTLPVRRELARTFSHALQCAIHTRNNCEEFDANQSETKGSEYGN